MLYPSRYYSQVCYKGTALFYFRGMKELLELAISNIEICLGSRPLFNHMFLTTPGLMNGMLLLTGAKGSGKSSVARALCRHVGELPNLAHTMVMECKPLRGKLI